MGHALMENRNGLVVDATLTTATGMAEREAAIDMVGDLAAGGRITLGGYKAYDTQDFVAEMRRLGVTPHVSQNTKSRRSAIDGRTTRHAGYVVSVRVRKRIEEVFGWMKTVGGLLKTVIAAPPGSAGCSPSSGPPTTWCASASFWRVRRSCIPSFRFDDVLGRAGWVMGCEALSDSRRQV